MGKRRKTVACKDCVSKFGQPVQSQDRLILFSENKISRQKQQKMQLEVANLSYR